MNPNADLKQFNYIQMQYWTPPSSQYIDVKTYLRLNLKQGNVSCEDTFFQPNLILADCLMTTWNLRRRVRTFKLKN